MATKVVFLKSPGQTKNYIERLNTFLNPRYKPDDPSAKLAGPKVFFSTKTIEEFNKTHSYRFPFMVLNFNPESSFQKCFVFSPTKPVDKKDLSIFPTLFGSLSLINPIDIPTPYLDVFNFRRELKEAEDDVKKQELTQLENECTFVNANIEDIYSQFEAICVKGSEGMFDEEEIKKVRRKTLNFEKVNSFCIKEITPEEFFKQEVKRERDILTSQENMLRKVESRKQKMLNALNKDIENEIRIIKKSIDYSKQKLDRYVMMGKTKFRHYESEDEEIKEEYLEMIWEDAKRFMELIKNPPPKVTEEELKGIRIELKDGTIIDKVDPEQIKEIAEEISNLTKDDFENFATEEEQGLFDDLLAKMDEGSIEITEEGKQQWKKEIKFRDSIMESKQMKHLTSLSFDSLEEQALRTIKQINLKRSGEEDLEKYRAYGEMKETLDLLVFTIQNLKKTDYRSHLERILRRSEITKLIDDLEAEVEQKEVKKIPD